MPTIPTLSDSLLQQAHAGTSFSPERRAASENAGYQAQAADLMHQCPGITQQDLNRYHRAYSAYLSAHGRCISTMITGGSNFPVRRAEKANESTRNRSHELTELKQRIIARYRRQAKKDDIAEQGGELAIARRKLETLERLQTTMKEANRIIRRKPKYAKTDEKVTALELLNLKSEHIESLFGEDFAGRIGFANYQLTNNNAKIKNTRDRVATLERREAAKLTPADDIIFEGGRIEIDADDDRIRIHHDAKPDRVTIDALKRSGWRWSRLNAAWQRQNTANALYSAKEIAGVGA
tara:strand:+ start:62540 stop:63421 length:882 start_codon:yes stop_codon:yes gene_type:complete